MYCPMNTENRPNSKRLARNGLVLLLAITLVGAAAAGCNSPPSMSCGQRCWSDHGSCDSCCNLLTGMNKEKCLASCECKRSCCLEECGGGVVGEWSTCRTQVENFDCDPDKAKDGDSDGFSFYDGDCDDSDPDINPDAREEIDGIDNNCDGYTDEDLDKDGYTEQDGDCDDNNPNINPLMSETCNDNVDNNCNGYTDEDEPDIDGDGFGRCSGDCNDGDPRIGPRSVEDATDMVDNDCDGLTDEPRVGCDCVDPTEGAVGFLEAIEICNMHQVVDVQTYGSVVSIDPFEQYGAVVPRTVATHPAVEKLLEQNCRALVMCSGYALSTTPQEDQGLGHTDPDPLNAGEQANDMAQLIIQFNVPHNAEGFSFDFMFLSSEYPEYVCTMFNDTFYAIEVSSVLNNGDPTNISFDGNDNEITVNNNFFEDPNGWTQDLTGTGYDVSDGYAYCNGDPNQFPGCNMPSPCPPPNNTKGSGTGWLRTTAPVEPGETMTLTFSIHDEGDHILDSCVIIDNFQWVTKPVGDPDTVK